MHITLVIIHNVRFGVMDRGVGGRDARVSTSGGKNSKKTVLSFPTVTSKQGEAEKCMFLQEGGCFLLNHAHNLNIIQKPLPNPPYSEFINVVSCNTHTDK